MILGLIIANVEYKGSGLEFDGFSLMGYIQAKFFCMLHSYMILIVIAAIDEKFHKLLKKALYIVLYGLGVLLK